MNQPEEKGINTGEFVPVEDPKTVEEENGVNSAKVARVEEAKRVEEGEDQGRTAAELKTVDEVVRERIRKLISEERSGCWLKRIWSHPLLLLVIGAAATGAITHYYTVRQQSLEREHAVRQKEIERERAFTDELNKIRVNRIGEVWEKTDTYDGVVRDLIAMLQFEPLQPGDSSRRGTLKKKNAEVLNERISQSDSLYRELCALLDKYRFWLDDDIYDITKTYAQKTYDHFVELNGARSDSEQNPAKIERVKQLEKERNDLRIELKEVRDKMLKGEW